MTGFFRLFRFQRLTPTLTDLVHEVRLLREALQALGPSSATPPRGSGDPGAESPVTPTSADWMQRVKASLGLIPEAELPVPWHSTMSDEQAWKDEQAALPIEFRVDPFDMPLDENGDEKDA